MMVIVIKYRQKYEATEMLRSASYSCCHPDDCCVEMFVRLQGLFKKGSCIGPMVMEGGGRKT